MSLVRVTRPRAPGKKPPKAKKKPPPTRDWDSTVHDLTVHRATPEDMVRRHEIHKSKNKALVHVELQERALKRKWKKQKQGAPDSLEKRKLALMREILSDQYQLQDVLERSDQAMAVVKDLFGDAPRRHTGFPNVTMAPHCDLESSQCPIVQKSDPPTQLSILSESIMDPQALNEVEGEGSSNCQSEDSVNEQDVSLHFKSNIDTNRLLHLLKEENAAGASQLWAEKQLRTPTPSQKANVAVTPTTALPSSRDAALNATRVVQRVNSRLQNEDEEQTSDSSYTVRQVLNPNPRKQKQVSTKVKRNHTAQMASKPRRNDSLANAVSFELPSGNKSSLDVLNRMIHEVEHEMEEYEQWTGREVQRMQNGHGLTGFTVSLVNTLCRLMRYLKESEMQLRQEATMRQQLEGMLNEHRALIDALTTEILLVREENAAIQKRLQQYMVVTDEQLISLTQAFKSLPVTDPNRGQNPTDFGVAVNSQEKPVLYSTVPRTDIFRRENTLVFSQEELPVKLPQWSSPPDTVVAGSSLPAHMFQPAVLLSPPRQKSIQEFSPLQNVKRNHTAQMASKPRRNDSLANAVSFELPSGNKSSLDVLNRMIHEVEHEMEEYEQWTGREVQRMQNGHGLTGFTVSLVNTLCRLMRYLKESEMQLRQEATMRQQLEGMLNEHRALIDALTTEILLVREENAAIQKRLQQYMVVTDEQLISLTQAFKSLPVTDPNRGQNPTDFGVAVNSQEKPVLYSTVPRTDIFRRENTLVFSQEELPVKLPQWSSPPDTVVAGSSLPAHMFQPAVLLSPPRQKSIQEFSPLQNALKKTVQTYPASHISPSMETTVREPNWQKSSSSSVGTQNTNEENRLLTQRWRIPPTHKDLESSLLSDGQQGRSTLSPVDRWAIAGSEDEQKPSAPEERTQSNDLLGQIAELTLQNSVIKAQLSKFRDRSQEAGDGLHQPVTMQNLNTSLGSAMQGQTLPEVPKSLEERIAELNRQSAEARGKLLQLIDQQKLATVNPISPPVSPVLPPPINWTENEKRTIEVSVPVAETMDSSKGDTPSPASGTSVRRSTGASSKTCSPLSTTSGSMKLTPVNQRTKVERQREEGWFALSMHIM
ncbi:Spindle and centriole-associated protein 1 [Platysternon megacephalum]|uniref:Spindle and centriole-associated protein 1 n=1 Tax=Platysternon megacephalum TaxID=55544 RepID=A0A4D9EBK4_9SAUR|nr:Spindle and centriole-associated protein 1 [Platysternon megacephalum]